MKTVVIGASSGLGRRIGIGLAQRGAEVALLARRFDRLVEAAEEAGPGACPIACDVTDPESCRAAIDSAALALGAIDSLVYAPGMGPLGRVEDIDAETWRQAFDTNVLGATLITAAALPHLRAGRGVAAYLSSVSASLTPPWPGLAAYVATKAALDKLIEAWRVEHPEIGFTRVVVGDCAPSEGLSRSEFNVGWDPDLFGDFYPIWKARGLTGNGLVDVGQLADVVDTVLRCGASASIPSVTVAPRPPG